MITIKKNNINNFYLNKIRFYIVKMIFKHIYSFIKNRLNTKNSFLLIDEK